MGLRSAGNSHWLLAEEVIRAHEEDPGPVPGVWAGGHRLTDLLTRDRLSYCQPFFMPQKPVLSIAMLSAFIAKEQA